MGGGGRGGGDAELLFDGCELILGMSGNFFEVGLIYWCRCKGASWCSMFIS